MTGQQGQTLAYVRVSSVDQNTARQHAIIEAAVGTPDKVFEEQVSGKSRTDRLALHALLSHARSGDTVAVASMDRLARSLSDLVALVEELTADGVRVVFVKEALTFEPGGSSPYAEFQMHVLGAVAQLERSIIRERQRDGIASAKQRGVYKGRTKALGAEVIAEARTRVEMGVPKAHVARELGVSRQTLINALAGVGAYSG